MPNLKKNRIRTLVRSDVDIFLTTNISVPGWSSNKKIKFNPHPSPRKKKRDISQENPVDFHVEMVKKIDALLEKYEKERGEKDQESATLQDVVRSLEELVEIREPFERKPEMPRKKTDFQSNETLNTIDIENELFDIERPDRTHSDFRFVTGLEESKDIVRIKNPESEHMKDGDFHNWMLSDQDKTVSNIATSFANIKVRKRRKTEKINGYTKTKIELEKTKEKIEKKKQELEEVEQKERKKEKELKKKKIEKIKKEKEEEKRKKLEMKKAQKEAKTGEQELKKKELERKKKEEERLRALEAKKAERNAEIKERELEKKKREKLEKKQEEERLKALKLKKQEKEAIKKSRLKEKERKLEAKKAIREEKLKRKLLEEKKLKKKKVEKEKKEPTTILKKKTEKETTEKQHTIFGKKEETNLDKEIQEVLAITDKLLENLPDKVIDKFVQSKDFELYEKVLNKYKIK